MNIAVEFVENDQVIEADFSEVTLATDGGFERGYAAGLADRTYELWAITLADGSVVEKEVALL